MISITFIFMAIVTALAVFAILAKTWAFEPKKAAKGEKGEILKQLLELSERESCVSPIASPAAKPVRRSPPSTKRPQDPKDAEIEAQIRQRAFELYQARGGVGGDATHDWQQAREEVMRSKAKAKAAKASS